MRTVISKYYNCHNIKVIRKNLLFYLSKSVISSNNGLWSHLWSKIVIIHHFSLYF